MNAKLKILRQYVSLKTSLQRERAEIQTRLQEIEAALGDNVMPVAFKVPDVEAPAKSKRAMSAANRSAVSAAAKARWAKYRAEKAGRVVEQSTAPAQPKTVGRFGNPISLPKAIVQVTSERPMTKQEILEAVQKIGYRFHTKEPLKSLNPILYGKKPKFNNENGKFSAGNVLVPKALEVGKAKRKMSAAGKARIIAGTKARWAKYNAAKAASTPKAITEVVVKPKRKVSAEGRKAIAAAAQARWAKVKAGKVVEKAKAPKRKGQMSPAGRVAIVAGQKARWAEVKAGKAGKK